MGVLTWCPKSRKSLKLRHVRPNFEIYAPFVVIQRRGCGVIRGEKLIISDIDDRLRWYVVKGVGFSDFL